MAAWVKPSANTYGTILRKKDQYSLARTTNGTIAWAFRKFNQPTLSYNDTGVVVPLNAWSHVVVVLEGTTVRTYLNGRLAHTATNVGDVYTWDGMNEPMTIGGAQDRGEYFKGVIDEVQLFTAGADGLPHRAVVPGRDAPARARRRRRSSCGRRRSRPPTARRPIGSSSRCTTRTASRSSTVRSSSYRSSAPRPCRRRPPIA